MKSGAKWTEETLREAETAIGYVFRDEALLLTAFTQSTYANHFGGESNERLEFLGDAVLQLVVTEKLLAESGADEGELTEVRKRLVSRPALERAERRLGLMRFLRYFGGEENVGGKTRSSLVEAVVAAVYLDGGLGAAAEFLDRCLREIETDNYKTMLQEYVQKYTEALPRYESSAEEGGFRCTVSALGAHAEGSGASKKEAETAAARALYHRLTERSS